MISWSPPNAFLKRLVPDPNRGSVTEFVDEVTELANQKIEEELRTGMESITTLIAWNKFMGHARCCWLCTVSQGRNCLTACQCLVSQGSVTLCVQQAKWGAPELRPLHSSEEAEP